MPVPLEIAPLEESTTLVTLMFSRSTSGCCGHELALLLDGVMGPRQLLEPLHHVEGEARWPHGCMATRKPHGATVMQGLVPSADGIDSGAASAPAPASIRSCAA